MFRSIIAVMATLAVSGFVHAQDAVQWTQAEGGNGHWYAAVDFGTTTPWSDARDHSISLGAQLASPNSQAEDDWLRTGLASEPSLWSTDIFGNPLIIGPWLGGYRPQFGEWTWIDGSEWDSEYDGWYGSGADAPEDLEAIMLYWDLQGSFKDTCRWQDYGFPEYVNNQYDSTSAIIEWSADCNGDGIVDYGQILDGSLSDENGNGVPDCCEDYSCIPAVQWKVEDGGNGHWYFPEVMTHSTEEDMLAAGEGQGASLASIASASEDEFVRALAESYTNQTALLGGKEISEDNFIWLDGTPFVYTNWDTNQPDGSNVGEYVAYYSMDDQDAWHDVTFTDSTVTHFILEWSADCNSDGIVDYGQILDGSLLDENGNGVPDICQQLDFGACCLGGTCVLTTNAFCFEAGGSYAGNGTICADANCPTTCAGDVNGDNQIGIIDLLTIIDGWGFCP